MNPATTTQLLQTSGGWGVAAFAIAGIVLMGIAIIAMWRRVSAVEDSRVSELQASIKRSSEEIDERGKLAKKVAESLEEQAEMVRFLVDRKAG